MDNVTRNLNFQKIFYSPLMTSYCHAFHIWI